MSIHPQHREIPALRLRKTKRRNRMNLFMVGNVVMYDGLKWEITGFGTDGNGHTTVDLARGDHRVTVLEIEIERVEG